MGFDPSGSVCAGGAAGTLRSAALLEVTLCQQQHSYLFWALTPITEGPHLFPKKLSLWNGVSGSNPIHVCNF